MAKLRLSEVRQGACSDWGDRALGCTDCSTRTQLARADAEQHIRGPSCLRARNDMAAVEAP